MKNNYFDRLLVVTTTGAVFLFLLAFGAYSHIKSSVNMHVPLEVSAVFGDNNAPVNLVIFEEIRCPGCQHFNKRIFPQIQAKYINSGKANYTVVPLSFFHGTKEAANAALSVYKFHPEQFLAYIEQLHELVLDPQQEVSADALVSCAAEVGGIDLAHLKRAIIGKFFYEELEKNLQKARSIMNGKIMTPALYINGSYCPSHSLREVERRINKELKHATMDSR